MPRAVMMMRRQNRIRENTDRYRRYMRRYRTRVAGPLLLRNRMASRIQRAFRRYRYGGTRDRPIVL